MRTRNLSSNATCTFQCISDDADKANGLLDNPDIVIPGRQLSVVSPAIGFEGRGSLPRRISGIQSEQVDFGQYVDEVS